MGDRLIALFLSSALWLMNRAGKLFLAALPAGYDKENQGG
jgi:hypothetical protein